MSGSSGQLWLLQCEAGHILDHFQILKVQCVKFRNISKISRILIAMLISDGKTGKQRKFEKWISLFGPVCCTIETCKMQKSMMADSKEGTFPMYKEKAYSGFVKIKDFMYSGY